MRADLDALRRPRRPLPVRRHVLTLAITLALAGGTSRAWATGADPGRATPVQREQAQARFVRGKQLYDDKHYDEAMTEFRAALDIVASPNARLYVARCLRETGKLVEAYVEFGRTAVEANEHAREDPRYARTGASAAAERDALAPRLGFVTVRVEHPTDQTTLTIGGDPVRRAAWGEPAPVMPGSTDIVVQEPNKAPVRQTVALGAGDKKDISVDAAGSATQAPAVEATTTATASSSSFDRRKLRPYAYAAGGVGAAGLLTFAIGGLLSNSAYNDLRSKCTGGVCPPSVSSEISSGKTEQTIANVGLVIGLVGVAAGVTLFVLSMPKSDSAGAASTELVVGPSWAGFRGAF